MAPAPRRAPPARRSAEAAPSRAPAPRTGNRKAAEEPVRSSSRGAAALRRMQDEQVAQEARKEARKATQGQPFRFFCPIGETRQIIVVDELPDFVRKEHATYNKVSKHWDTFVPCIDEHDNCPVCDAAERPSYFALYLTVIDLTPYINKDDEEVPFSKKLLVVKPTQQKKIVRLYEKHKTLRGMILDMTRDNDKDATIGGDIEFVDFVDEEELQSYIYDYKDKENKVHEVDCSVPFEYEEIMPDMTAQQLRAIVGGRPAPGNRASADRDLQDDWEEPPQRRASSRRGAAADDDVPEPAARRPAPRRAAAPEPEAEEEQEEAAPPARRAAPAGRRRAAEPEPEAGEPPFEPDEQEEEAAPAPARRAAPARRTAAEDPPQRPARDSSAVAQRRASLRRT